jgi:hypothetical protein
MRTRIALLAAIVTLLVLSATALAGPAPSGLAAGSVEPVTLSGGRYQLVAQGCDAANGSTASGGGYRLTQTVVPSEATGCCCKKYLPKARRQ